MTQQQRAVWCFTDKAMSLLQTVQFWRQGPPHTNTTMTRRWMKSWPLHQVVNRKRSNCKQREISLKERGKKKCNQTRRRRVVSFKHIHFNVFFPPYTNHLLEWKNDFLKCSSMRRGQGLVYVALNKSGNNELSPKATVVAVGKINPCSTIELVLW